MSTTVQIVYNQNTIDVLWSFAMDIDDRALVQNLIEGVEGVEECDVRRYSAAVRIASHVHAPKYVAEEIAAALAEDIFLPENEMLVIPHGQHAHE